MSNEWGFLHSYSDGPFCRRREVVSGVGKKRVFQKKEVEANGSRVAAPAAPVEVTTPKEPAAPPPPTPAQVKQERKELLGPVRKSTCVRPAWRYYLLFWPPEGVDAARECLASSHEAS